MHGLSFSAEADRLPAKTIALYEVIKTPVLRSIEPLLFAAGYEVKHWPTEQEVHLILAHVGEEGWQRLIGSIAPGTVCVRVSSVSRPSAPPPRESISGVITLELLPAVGRLGADEWNMICDSLFDPAEVRRLVEDPFETATGSFFTVPGFPWILLTLWVQCATYLKSSSASCRDSWMYDTRRMLSYSHASGDTVEDAAEREWKLLRCSRESTPLVALLQALKESADVPETLVRDALITLSIALNQRDLS